MSLHSHPSIASAHTCSTVVDLLTYQSQSQPDAIAFTFLQHGLQDGDPLEANLTFGQLDQHARAIGATLQSLQATGARVLLLYPSGLDYIAAYFGCLYAGAIAVPMYPPHLKRPADRLQAIVDDAQATMALTTSDLLPNLKQWSAQVPGLSTLTWLATDTLCETTAATWQAPDIDGESLAFLQYSSGSTASPKGVMVSHRNLLHNQRVLQEAQGHNDQTIIVSWLPLYHDLGLIGNVLQSVYLGARCILLTPASVLQRPVRWLQAISRYRGTSSGAPNFAYDLCASKVTQAQRAALDLSSWTIALNGAEPLRAATLDRFTDAFAPCGFRREAFYPAYGLAEATLMVSGTQRHTPPVLLTVQKAALSQHRVVHTHPEANGAHTLVSSGRPHMDQHVRIVNPETSSPCPPDQVGEIWVSSPSVAHGYWNRPETTSETFGAHLATTGDGPFLRTGDLGFLHQGELFITGRLKDVLIIHGHNHYPQDIELTVEQSHPALRSNCGAAFSVDSDGGERVVVVQELERHAQLTPRHQLDDTPDASRLLQTIFTTIRRQIAENHGLQVHAIVLIRMGSLPKTSSGKIQRRACKAAFLNQTLTVTAEWYTPSAGPAPSRPRDQHPPLRFKGQSTRPRYPQVRTTNHLLAA